MKVIFENEAKKNIKEAFGFWTSVKFRDTKFITYSIEEVKEAIKDIPPLYPYEPEYYDCDDQADEIKVELKKDPAEMNLPVFLPMDRSQPPLATYRGCLR